MRKFFILLTIFLLWSAPSFAQQMSDDEVVAYVMEQQKSGVTQQKIVSSLMKKGVTMTQINRIKTAYEKRRSNVPAGNTLDVKNRTRTVPQKGENLLIETQEDKNRILTKKEQQLQMTEEASFLLPQDTAQLVQQLMLQLAEQEKTPIFGHNIFQDKELTFEPVSNMATPQNYRLGPGDQVIIDVWGASELNIQEEISPDGGIFVGNIGMVYLNGMTIKEATDYLKQQLSEIASLNGEEPTSKMKVSLGQNRSIQVSIMGEVVVPGTYTLSSFASVFHALYQAGGVNDIGSLRSVKVNRNNQEILNLDIYDYLLNGKLPQDIRLEDGDVVVVDTYDNLVNIAGRVKRPMFYEMKSDETVSTLLDYAGGFSKDAYRGDVRLIRMGQRERQIFTLNDEEQKSFKVMDGDSVSVDSISATFENMVEAKGAFYRPGTFQIGGHIHTIKNLIETAGGLRGDAFLNRAVLNRKKDNLMLENLSVNVKGIMDGTSEDIPLRKNDVLYVPALSDLQELMSVDIYGEVAFPGSYEYAENTTIEDLIIMAGGLKDQASTVKVDVSRRIRNSKVTSSTDVLAKVFSFELKDGLRVDHSDSAFTLLPFDAVYVRKSPGYYEQQNVRLQGEILFEGTYVLEVKNQRLSDIVKRAGGLTSEAYPKGARLERRMNDEEKLRAKTLLEMIQRQQDSIDVRSLDIGSTYYVGIELDKALKEPGSDADIVLQDGDRLIIPQLSNTVKIQGSVMYPNTVSFKEGEKLKYYIEQAGGYGSRAKKSKAFIVYMNGTVARASKYSRNLIQPGCEIVVPQKPERKGMTTAEILSLSSTSASLATVVLALINLLK